MTIRLRSPALAVLALLYATGVVAAQPGAPYRVIVSIPPQKFLVESIGGPLVDVGVMLQPGHAAETFEPTPAQMAGVAGARFYFAIGVPFERAWLPEIRRQNPGLGVIECCAQFGPARAGDHDDPHIWVNPILFLRAAQLVHAALVGGDAGNRAVYDRNYRKLSAELTMVHRDLRYLLKDRRIDQFIISHGALGPLAEAHGLEQIALESAGREPGPRTLAAITDRARELGIRVVLVEKQHGRGPVAALARELGAELLEVDPLAGNYRDNMRAIGRALGMATR